jgi:hypothetical protein
MGDRIRICVWATTFQANIYSLTRYLAADPRFELVAAVPALERYLQEPIAARLPIPCRFLDRESPEVFQQLADFAAEILIVDNHHPRRIVAPRLLNVWHGFGWRGPEDRAQFAEVHRSIARHTGAPADRPNPRFRWITAGETNRRHRVQVTGFHPDNVLPLGQAYLDDVAFPPVARDQVLADYPASFHGRRIVLFAPTWHYGRIFAHLGDDFRILERMFGFLADHDVALVFRMHDRKRFEPSYVADLEQLNRRFPNVWLKWRDESQDNLSDLLVADVMVSNYSSILTYFYATCRPSVHLHPVDRRAKGSVGRTLKGGRLRTDRHENADYIWSLPATEVGGLVAEGIDTLLAACEQALREPDCCRELAQGFLARHAAPVDGQICRRIADALIELREAPAPNGAFARLLDGLRRRQ